MNMDLIILISIDREAVLLGSGPHFPVQLVQQLLLQLVVLLLLLVQLPLEDLHLLRLLAQVLRLVCQFQV